MPSALVGTAQTDAFLQENVAAAAQEAQQGTPVEAAAAKHTPSTEEEKEEARRELEHAAVVEAIRKEEEAINSIAQGKAVDVMCIDRNPALECGAWAAHGECTRNSGFMRAHCRKSCNLCDGLPVAPDPPKPPKPPATPPPPPKCQDRNDLCSSWARAGECERNLKFMHSQCMKSCGQCVDPDAEQEEKDAMHRRHKAAEDAGKPFAESAPAQGTAPASSAVQCVDANNRCPEWGEAGECRRNPTFMRTNCPKTCDLCNEIRFQKLAAQAQPAASLLKA